MTTYTDDDYPPLATTYWRMDDDILIRRDGPDPDSVCDVWTNGAWVPINPKRYGGAVDPWASSIGNGEGVQLKPADLPEGAL